MTFYSLPFLNLLLVLYFYGFPGIPQTGSSHLQIKTVLLLNFQSGCLWFNLFSCLFTTMSRTSDSMLNTSDKSIDSHFVSHLMEKHSIFQHQLWC